MLNPSDPLDEGDVVTTTLADKNAQQRRDDCRSPSVILLAACAADRTTVGAPVDVPVVHGNGTAMAGTSSA